MIGDDARLIERFLEMLAAEAGAARNTILAYRTDLDQTLPPSVRRFLEPRRL